MKIDLVVSGYIFAIDKVLLVLHAKLGKWLPPGGHIEVDETPDDALRREVKEETGLNIEILNQSDLPASGNVKINLATPFYVNVHPVGDHDHCCFYYVCTTSDPDRLIISAESIDIRWFALAELNSEEIPIDVRNQALKAFEIYEKR